jgi:beta-lactamase class A
MRAASVIKVPLMVVAHHQWRSGLLKRTAVDAERMRKMITLSDNASADALIDRLGMSQVNTWLLEHNYEGTQLKHKMAGPHPDGENETTARDMTRMLLQIEQGTLVSALDSEEMRGLLLDQQRRTRIPAGLPSEVTVGNKTGTLRGVVNDVGFVETPDGTRYALAVFIAGPASDAAASQAIARLSRKVYEWVTTGTAE